MRHFPHLPEDLKDFLGWIVDICTTVKDGPGKVDSLAITVKKL